MRLWNLCLAVLILAVVLALIRDETGRVGVIVFATGLLVTVSGTAATLGIFRSLAALVDARTTRHHLEALAALLGILAAGSSTVLGAIFAGAYLIRWSLG